MRLISCHIENFGKLSDLTFNFEEGLNTFCKENGWGKSTFAAFIRAMFYGLEAGRKQGVIDNDRKRYLPWQKGVYGGQLVFEINDREYIISRVFAEKAADDEFELRDHKTNLISNDYTANIGEEIFKINKASFSKTVFIEQSDCQTGATDDINAKIGNLTDTLDDISSFDQAILTLKKVLNALNPGRLPGSIKAREGEIAKYERKILDRERIQQSIEAAEALLKTQEEEKESLIIKRDTLEARQAEVARLQTALGKKAEYERLQKEVDDKWIKLAEISRRFPSEDIPTEAEVKEQIDKISLLAEKKEGMRLNDLTSEEISDLGDLELIFKSGIPSESEIDKVLDKCREYTLAKQNMNRESMSEAEIARLNELKAIYADDVDDISEKTGKWNERLTIKATIPSNKATLLALRTALANRPKPVSPAIPLVIAGIIALAGGIVCIAIKSVIPGIILTIAGLAAAITGFLVNKNRPVPEETTPEIDALEKQIYEDEERIAIIDSEMRRYLEKHLKVYDENTVLLMIQKIAEERTDYKFLSAKAWRINENAAEVTKLEDIATQLEEYLKVYRIQPVDDHFSEAVYKLRSEIDRYSMLKSKYANYTLARQEYDAVSIGIVSFLAKYKYERPDDLAVMLEEIRGNVFKYKAARDILDDDIEDLSQFKATNDMEALNSEELNKDIPSLESLNAKIQDVSDRLESIREAISRYNANIEDLQESLDEILEDEQHLEELKDVQSEEIAKHKYVGLASSHLTSAKEAMTAKYSDPLLASFKKYYKAITGTDAEAYNINANAEITVSEYGKQRKTETLSTGYRDLIGICLRMALIDAMYPDEAPVIVMDDPFTNLDDEKLELSRHFLEEVSRKYQLVYFTCSGSRK